MVHLSFSERTDCRGTQRTPHNVQCSTSYGRWSQTTKLTMRTHRAITAPKRPYCEHHPTTAIDMAKTPKTSVQSYTNEKWP